MRKRHSDAIKLSASGAPARYVTTWRDTWRIQVCVYACLSKQKQDKTSTKVFYFYSVPSKAYTSTVCQFDYGTTPRRGVLNSPNRPRVTTDGESGTHLPLYILVSEGIQGICWTKTVLDFKINFITFSLILLGSCVS